MKPLAIIGSTSGAYKKHEWKNIKHSLYHRSHYYYRYYLTLAGFLEPVVTKIDEESDTAQETTTYAFYRNKRLILKLEYWDCLILPKNYPPNPQPTSPSSFSARREHTQKKNIQNRALLVVA